MTDVMKSYAARPRNSQWVDLSEKHKRARERLQEGLDAFAKGEGAKALNIVGPYGSGKSELMAWGFDYAWTELGIPAVFVNLETLLDCLPEQLGPTTLVQALEAFLNEQLQGIVENLQTETSPQETYLAPDLRYDECFLNYFRALFGDSCLGPERIRQIIEGGRAVLFLDEIEQKYNYLMERVPSDDGAPFREVVQAVDHGRIAYYLVGSFGLTSAYEIVSDADTRREGTISLPIPDPAELARLGDVAEFANFVWWASRGRPGWAVKFAQEWEEDLLSIDRMEDFANLRPNTIERLPIVDGNALSGLFADSEQNRVITRLMKLMSPIPLTQIKGGSQDGEELLGRLRRHHFLVAHRQHLVTVDDLCDAMMTDLQSLSKEMETIEPDWQLLRYYLRKVLRATADVEDHIVFGGWRDKNEWAAKGAISPLLVLLQDVILEFEGDRSNVAEALNFIKRVFERCKIVAEQVTDAYQVVDNFHETLRLFREVMDVKENTYISLAPKAVESLFPRMVVHPLLRLNENAKRSIGEQRAHVEASVAGSGRFLTAKERRDGTEVIFVFVPDQTAVREVQGQFFSRQRQRDYLTADRVHVLLPLSEGSEDLQIDYETNSDVRILEQEVKKVQQKQVGEQRLRDFLLSLWHDWLLRSDVDDEEDDIFKIGDTIIENPRISKSDRRKLEYYCNRLQQRLDDMGSEAARAFRLKLKSLFEPGSDDFPDKRIHEALTRVKEARAVEQVALAFDVRRFPEESLEILYELRQLDNLRQFTKSPHGYSEFLETYAAVKEARGDIRPALNLKEIMSYLKGHNDFAPLMKLAGDLGLDRVSDWAEATEGTEGAPLLRLFGNMTESQKVFIRGLSLNSYLEHNKEDLVRQTESLVVKAADLKNSLRTLQDEVRSLNESLEEDVLAATKVEKILEEVESLHKMLKDARGLPPAVLYILYRFSQSGLRELETQRQRWSGGSGIEGWRNLFRGMLDWRERLEGYKAELQEVYATNGNSKIHLFGREGELIQEIEKQTEDAVTGTLDKLDKSNELSDPLPDVDLSEYTEALETVRIRVQEIRGQARKVDELSDSMEEIQQRVSTIICKLS